MQIIHTFKNLNIKKAVKDSPSFILTNKNGSYLYFDTTPKSKYQGFFCYLNDRMFRVVEDIEPLNAQLVDTVINNFNSIERKRANITESFFLPEGLNTFIYELNKGNYIDVFLDIKESYDNRQFGRYYQITQQGNTVIIEFTKRTNFQEDNSEGNEEYKFYLVIKSSSSAEVISNWVKREYPLDKERNSMPFERYVFNAVKIFGRKFVFSFGTELKDVIKEANFVFYNLKQIKNKESKIEFEHPRKIKDNEISMAYLCAVDSLKSLLVHSKQQTTDYKQLTTNNQQPISIFAGLPWFFQFWSRDELISCKALMLIGMKKEAGEILRKYIESIGIYGTIGNKFPNPDLRSADSIGWLFKGIGDYMEIFGINSRFAKEIKKEFFRKLVNSVDDLILHHTEMGLAKNNSRETWMDTSFDGDDRNGFRIEIQALRLLIYKFMYNLTKNLKYKRLELNMRKEVKKKFFNGKILADGLDDWTIRPNIFISAYVYPELLTKSEWSVCFENALKELWLDWGGLATISKSHKLFTPAHTGENPKSYHRGDSWFWVNNLSAIVMHRINKNILNKDKFYYYIMKILEASKNEILYSGAIGRHAEVSSANELKSQGCLLQAFSCAMFVELVGEVFGKDI